MAQVFPNLDVGGPLGALFDPFVAAWMLSPDAAVDDLTLTSLCVQYKITPPDVRPFVSHGTAPVGTSGGTGTGLSADQARDHLLYLEALADVLADDVSRRGMSAALWDVELPLVGVLADMGCRGIGFDLSASSELNADIEARMAELEKQVAKLWLL